LAVAGAAASGFAGQNDIVRNAGAGAMAVGLTALSIKAIEKERDKVMRAGIFPSSHLYSGDFEVPPGLFLRRWALVQAKNADILKAIRNMKLKYFLGSQQWLLPLTLRGNP
jgi:hypothetical protein